MMFKMMKPATCPTARFILFRTSSAPEITLNGVVYVRTKLDDGPRYIQKKG